MRPMQFTPAAGPTSRRGPGRVFPLLVLGLLVLSLIGGCARVPVSYTHLRAHET